MFEHLFMQKALLASLLLSITLAPLGVFLISRRMSLMGDAISHALLPGIIIAVLLFGNSPLFMMLGALVAGITIALLTPFFKKISSLKEDAAFASLTILFLAFGVALAPLAQNGVELTHLLFGSLLSLDDVSLIALFIAACLVLLFFGLFYRLLVIDTFDPLFLKLHGKGFIAPLFLILVVVALVASFQASGTLLSVGFMLIPALTARVWGKTLIKQLMFSVGFAFLASFIGLLLSFYINLSASASLMLAAGAIYALSLIIKGLQKNV